MPLEFSAGEVLEMACQIERNGARFYRKAAEAAPDEARRRKLLDLAAMEEEHLATFTGMARALSERERTTPVYDPDNLAGQYLRALADARVFDVSADPAAQLTGGESLESVLLTARTPSFSTWACARWCPRSSAGTRCAPSSRRRCNTW